MVRKGEGQKRIRMAPLNVVKLKGVKDNASKKSSI